MRLRRHWPDVAGGAGGSAGPEVAGLRRRPFARGFVPMKPLDWQTFKGLPKLLETSPAEPPQQAERIVTVQLHIVLPIKVGVIAIALYYLFFAGWLSEELTIRWVVQQTLQRFFLVYVVCNAVAGVVLFFWRRFPPGPAMISRGLSVFAGGGSKTPFASPAPGQPSPPTWGS